MSASSVRLFVAVDIPSGIRGIIAEATRELRGGPVGARWVKPENLHLTLKFIGEYEEEKLPDLSGEVHKAAQRGGPFNAALGGCGAFPSRKKARVIWIGMVEGSGEAVRIAAKLDSRLEKARVEREKRPFRSHLTLARLKRPQDCTTCLETLESKMEGISQMSFQVGEIVIYQSILSPQGPTYIARERIGLGRD